jgi:hypothetical protein
VPRFMKNITAMLKEWVESDLFHLVGAGAPTNGTSGTGVGLSGPGSTYTDSTNKNVYVNVGTKASPQWALMHPTTLADADVLCSVPIVYRIDIAAGANADKDVVVTHKIRVVDAAVVLRGAGVASEVMTVKNGANAITNGIAASGADTTVTRAGTIDDAQWEIAAGGTLRVTGSAGASMPACTVYVWAHRVA